MLFPMRLTNGKDLGSLGAYSTSVCLLGMIKEGVKVFGVVQLLLRAQISL